MLVFDPAGFSDERLSPLNKSATLILALCLLCFAWSTPPSCLSNSMYKSPSREVESRSPPFGTPKVHWRIAKTLSSAR